MTDETQDRLQKGLKLIRAGRREEARAVLAQALLADPGREEAWLALSLCIDDPDKQRDCLEHAQRLQRARTGSVSPAPPAREPAAAVKPVTTPPTKEQEETAKPASIPPAEEKALTGTPAPPLDAHTVGQIPPVTAIPNSNAAVEPTTPTTPTVPAFLPEPVRVQPSSANRSVRAAAARKTVPLTRERRGRPTWVSALMIILLLALLVALAVATSSVISDLTISFGPSISN